MFIDFFYTLRRHEVDVSPVEWLTLLEALNKGLARNSLTEFYYISRAVLVKSEQEYDNFDAAFLEYFRRNQDGDLLEQALHSGESRPGAFMSEHRRADRTPGDKSEVDGGISATPLTVFNDAAFGNGLTGTAGMEAMEGGTMVGSEAGKSAFDLAESRTFRDFREDAIISERQFQVALRRLRQLSNHVPTPETELDVDATIHKTSDKGGLLHVVMKKPRKNIIKLMLLMDSGGSMYGYSKFCTALFQAATKSNFFKELKIYYFHNCIYNKLYHDPTCNLGESTPTEKVLHNIDGEYKVIIVGDAAMAPIELGVANYQAEKGEELFSGKEWMQRLKRRYRKIVWLNPEDDSNSWVANASDNSTRRWLAGEFDMYLFTLKNFEKAMRKLLAG